MYILEKDKPVTITLFYPVNSKDYLGSMNISVLNETSFLTTSHATTTITITTAITATNDISPLHDR